MEIGIIMQSPAPNWVTASAGAKLGLSLAKPNIMTLGLKCPEISVYNSVFREM